MTGNNHDIVLASASPRRSEMLSRVGIDFRVIASNVNEEVLPGETAEEHVIRLSSEKALHVAHRHPESGRWFIGSDTVVVRDRVILGKPKSADDARTMLESLSGRSHKVISGYAVHDRQTSLATSAAVTTRVFFKELTSREIEGYIATGEPFDKAGAYAIQGIGSFMVLKIEGSYTNVVGMPLCEVIATLEEMQAIKLFGD